MRSLVLCASLLAAAPTLAAGLDDGEPRLQGIYGALGGGGGLLSLSGESNFGYDAEARLGYSFGPMLQIYLSAALDGGNFSASSFKAYQVDAFVQYHFVVRPSFMVYARGGAGVGLSGDVFATATAAGFAFAAGVGSELRLAPDVFIAPELFYRNADLATNGIDQRLQVFGLQLAFVYY
jgi:outer membrane protein with beta-barrel domain